jgi:hypothetical protein
LTAAKRVRSLVLGAALPGKHLAVLNQALRVSFLDRPRLGYDRRHVDMGRLNTVSERGLINGDKRRQKAAMPWSSENGRYDSLKVTH